MHAMPTFGSCRRAAGRSQVRGATWRCVLAVLLAAAVLGGVNADVASANTGCKPYVVIGARGSSEAGDYGDGPVLTTVNKLKSLDGSTQVLGYAPLNAAAGYRAVPVYTLADLEAVEAATGLGGAAGAGGALSVVVSSRKASYDASVADGKDALRAVIDGAAAGCPATKFVLIGYSQGAHVVQDVVDALPDSARRQILAVALFGDPRFNPRAKGALDTFSPARHGLLGQRDLHAQDVPTRTYCRAGDPVCQGFGHVSYVFPAGAAVEAFSPGAHMKYPDQDAGFAASFIWQRIRKDIAASGAAPPPRPAPTPRAVDVSVVVDTTGSMSSAISNVRANLAEIRDRLASTSTDFRLALSEFKDAGDVYQSRHDVDLTADATSFSDAVSTLSASGGGDLPESVFAGIHQGLGVTWRADSAHVVLVIGDAPPKDPEPVTGYTSSGILAESQRMRAPIYALPICCDSDADAAFSSLATGSGGQTLRAASGAGVADAILQAISEQSASPSFSSSATDVSAGSRGMRSARDDSTPTAAPVGSPIPITAADVTSPLGEDLTYHWDFGDGQQLTSDGPVVDHVWSSPFHGDVVVTATDEDGRSAQRRTAVDVSGAPLPLLSGFRAPALSATSNGIEITWSAPDTGHPVLYEVIDADDTTVAAFAPRADGSLVSQTVIVGALTSKTLAVVATDPLGRTITSPDVAVPDLAATDPSPPAVSTTTSVPLKAHPSAPGATLRPLRVGRATGRILSLRGRRVRVRLRCPVARRCTARVYVQRHRKSLGFSSVVRLGPGASRIVTVKLERRTHRAGLRLVIGGV